MCWCRSWDSKGVYEGIRTYRQLQVLNMLHNDLNATFAAGFVAITCIVTVMMLYGMLVGYEVLHPLLYVLFPSSALFGMIMQTAFYAQGSEWVGKSREFMGLISRNASRCSLWQERQILMREVCRLKPLKINIGSFATLSLDTAQECVDRTFNNLLLVMSP